MLEIDRDTTKVVSGILRTKARAIDGKYGRRVSTKTRIFRRRKRVVYLPFKPLTRVDPTSAVSPNVFCLIYNGVFINQLSTVSNKRSLTRKNVTRVVRLYDDTEIEYTIGTKLIIARRQ